MQLEFNFFIFFGLQMGHSPFKRTILISVNINKHVTFLSMDFKPNPSYKHFNQTKHIMKHWQGSVKRWTSGQTQDKEQVQADVCKTYTLSWQITQSIDWHILLREDVLNISDSCSPTLESSLKIEGSQEKNGSKGRNQEVKKA